MSALSINYLRAIAKINSMTKNPTYFLAFQSEKSQNGPKEINGQCQQYRRHGESKDAYCLFLFMINFMIIIGLLLHSYDYYYVIIQYQPSNETFYFLNILI